MEKVLKRWVPKIFLFVAVFLAGIAVGNPTVTYQPSSPYDFEKAIGQLAEQASATGDPQLKATASVLYALKGALILKRVDKLANLTTIFSKLELGRLEKGLSWLPDMDIPSSMTIQPRGEKI